MLKFCRYMMPQKQTLEELHKIASQQSVLFSPEALETIGAAKANQSALTLRLKTMSYQVIPTPLHVLDRISPIFPPFFPVFCAFSSPRRDGSNEPQAGTQGQETVARAPKHRLAA